MFQSVRTYRMTGDDFSATVLCTYVRSVLPQTTLYRKNADRQNLYLEGVNQDKTIVRDGKTMDVDETLDQEESSVNGSSSSDSNGNSQNKQNNQNGNGQNGYGNGNGNGNSDGGTGDGGGFSAPFGLW